MAFEDYKDLDASPEEATPEEIKELTEKYGVSECFAEKTILQPWDDDSIKAEFESTRVLTEEEKKKLIFCLIHLRGGVENLVLPSFISVRSVLCDESSSLVDTLQSLRYHW